MSVGDVGEQSGNAGTERAGVGIGKPVVKSDNRTDVQIVDGRIIVSTNWLKANLPASRASISNWTKDGMPKLGRGAFDLVDVLTWRGLIGDPDKAASNQDATALVQKKLKAEAELKEAQNQMTRFKNDVNSGLYVKKIAVETELRRLLGILKKSVLMIPRRVAGEIAGSVGIQEAKLIETHITDMVTDALTQMSESAVWKP